MNGSERGAKDDRKYKWGDYGAWLIPGEGGKVDKTNVFGGFADEYDKHRPGYPEDTFKLAIEAVRCPTERMRAIDVGCGTGRGAIAMAALGVGNVLATDHDAGMLEACKEAARQRNVCVQTRQTTAEETGESDGSVDLITVCQAFHWFDADRALGEFYRILRPDGVMAICWNDRDLSTGWVSSMEGIIEEANSKYSRFQKQSDDWEPILTRGGLFRLENFYQLAHGVEYQNAQELIQLVSTMSYVRRSLDEKEQEKVYEKIRATVGEATQSKPFILPYKTKLYILKKI